MNYRFSIYLLLFALCCTPQPTISASPLSTLSQDEIQRWREDIDFLASELEKHHINLYHQVSADEFKSHLADIKQNLGQMNRHELMVALMTAVNLVGDGHTQLAYWGGEFHLFPIRLRFFAEDLRVISTTPQHQQLLGAKLVAVNGKPVAEVIQHLSPMAPTVENTHSLKQSLATIIKVGEVLVGSKLADDPLRGEYIFELPDGEQQSKILQAITLEEFRSQVTTGYSINYPGSFTLKETTNGLEFYIDKAFATAYLQFNAYPAYADMRTFAESIQQHLQTEQIRHLIIDLRQNGGGDFFIGLLLAWALNLVDNLDWNHGIYTLIGRQTFSAAVSNAAQFRQILNAKLVGEPTGGNPYGYQDMGTFYLPHSNWPVTYSKRLFRFQDQFSPGLQPDVLIEYDWASWQKGIDPQLNWIIDDINAHRE